MVVLFPAYRRFEAARVDTNDAMMALLIGARLGSYELASSAADPAVLLPLLYGRIEGIERLNRTVGDAAKLLDEAEHHLTSMAIPYVLAAHGAFVSAAAKMLREDGKDDRTVARSVPWREDLTELPLSEAHEYVIERAGRPLPGELLELFRLARRIRNRVIHHGGTAGSRLPGEYRVLSKDARASWERLAGRKLSVKPDGRMLDLGAGELIAVLAITHRLAQAVNEMLIPTLSRAYWANLVVADYRSLAPQHFGERAQRARRLKGHARTHYGPLLLTESELATAADTQI